MTIVSRLPEFYMNEWTTPGYIPLMSSTSYLYGHTLQVSLTPHANQLIAQMMQLGFDNPAALIEVALERMAQEELTAADEGSPDLIAFMQRQVAIGLKLPIEEISVPLPLMS
jgi:hypothetical protein